MVSIARIVAHRPCAAGLKSLGILNLETMRELEVTDLKNGATEATKRTEKNQFAVPIPPFAPLLRF
jgi:hypothetical protein